MLSDLMTLTCGGELPRPATPARQTMLAVTALLAALGLAAVWGLAAGSAAPRLALANAGKVPMVVLLAALTAMPAGMVTLRLARARLGAVELATSFALAIFGGTLVLATLAPLVAIYYHTSAKAGLPLAVGSVFVALAVGALLFLRAVARLAPDRASRLAVVVLVAIFLAALLQFVALASPIIATPTPFDGGFDSLLGS